MGEREAYVRAAQSATLGEMGIDSLHEGRASGRELGSERFGPGARLQAALCWIRDRAQLFLFDSHLTSSNFEAFAELVEQYRDFPGWEIQKVVIEHPDNLVVLRAARWLLEHGRADLLNSGLEERGKLRF